MPALPVSTACMRGLWPLLTSLVTTRAQYAENLNGKCKTLHAMVYTLVSQCSTGTDHCVDISTCIQQHSGQVFLSMLYSQMKGAQTWE